MLQKKTESKEIGTSKNKAKGLLKATVAAFAIVWVAMTIMAIVWGFGGRRRWPPVADSATLLGDCATLLSQPGPIEEEDWPPSVKSLRPISVNARDDVVVIMISKGGIGGPYGYLVYPDGRKTAVVRPGNDTSIRFVAPGLFKYAAGRY